MFGAGVSFTKLGMPADSFFAIVNGCVIKLCRIDAPTKREAVIDILSEGSLFGESALYSKAGRRENCANYIREFAPDKDYCGGISKGDGGEQSIA